MFSFAKKTVFLFSISCFASGFSFASEPNCNTLGKPIDFYLCSLKRHPEIALIESHYTLGDATVSKASQLTNPELEFKTALGNNAGEAVIGTEVSLAFPISDYLFVRPKRVRVAQSEKSILDTEGREKYFGVQQTLIKDMFRLRQIINEIQFVDEALSTFSTIEKQFRGRRALGPEQEITFTLVSLAQSDYSLKRNNLMVERQTIESRFRTIWDTGFVIKPEFLPAFRKDWPNFSQKLNFDNHFELRRSLADKNRFEAEYDAAVVESWPNIKLGPVLERNVEGPTGYFAYGALLSMDLPLFGFNYGGRRQAEAQKTKADMNHELTIRKVNFENELVTNRYASSIAALKSSEDRERLEHKHERIDSLFRQGLVSGPTILEAHRQILDFKISQHLHEMTALDSFLELNQLRGEDPAKVFP